MITDINIFEIKVPSMDVNFAIGKLVTFGLEDHAFAVIENVGDGIHATYYRAGESCTVVAVWEDGNYTFKFGD